MRNLLAAAAVLVVSSFGGAFASTGSIPMGPYKTVTSDTSYGPAVTQGAIRMGWVSSNGITICKPVDRAGLPAGPHPGIIFVHGGAMTSGDRQNYTTPNNWCGIWASYGYLAASIDYRLDRSGTGNVWPAPLVDTELAIRYLRANATSLNLSQGLLTCLGDSAGAKLCELAGYTPGTLVSNDPAMKLYPTYSAKPTSVVPMFGPSLGGSSSPSAILSENFAHSPDTVLVQGTLDHTVPPINSQTIYDILVAHQRPATYISFVGQHEFVGCNGDCYFNAWRSIMKTIGDHNIYFGGQVFYQAP
jgi:acetyl esterase/lipase